MAGHDYKYLAPITLGFKPNDGDLIRGTVNGVEVNGQWIGKTRYASLYREGNTNVPLCEIEFSDKQAFFVVKQESAPTNDYELHLYRYTPKGIVKIPREYVDGLEETKNTADAAESLHYTLEEKNYGGVYDKKTEGRDTFKCNGFDYYKISDFAATYVEIKQFSGTYNNGTERSEVFAGKNCVVCGGFIVVNASGQCSYTNKFGTFEFTSPSAGLYAQYEGDTHPLTAGSYNFTFNIIAPIVTNLNTYKKYYITVDDTGTLKATEIT